MQPDNHILPQSFDEAFSAHRSAMLSRAKSIVKNDADAEDAVQEALERAWRSRKRFVTGANPKPWLLKITTNVAINFLERRPPGEGDAPSVIVDMHSAAEHDVLQREAVRSIGAAVQNLAPAHRTAFVLHDLHGYSSREISLRERVPYHTVRTHLFRARRELRRALIGDNS